MVVRRSHYQWFAVLCRSVQLSWREVFVVVDGLGSFISGGVRVILCNAVEMGFLGSIIRSTGENE